MEVKKLISGTGKVMMDVLSGGGGVDGDETDGGAWC